MNTKRRFDYVKMRSSSDRRLSTGLSWLWPILLMSTLIRRNGENQTGQLDYRLTSDFGDWN